MSIWRGIWGTGVMLMFVSAVRAGGASGWLVLMTFAGTLAVLAGLTVFGWVENERRWAWVWRAVGWTFVVSTVLLGLPVLVGPWIIVVVLVFALSCPPGIGWARDVWRTRRPVRTGRRVRRLCEADLERRWRRTSWELRHAVSAADGVALVQERAVLLDEIERRDPARFAARLERAGWPTSGAAAD